MAMVTYARGSLVDSSLTRILTENGYIDISGSPFLGRIMDLLRSSLRNDFNGLYEIAANVDIGRARGEFLDRWGAIMDEPREMLRYAIDLSLDNSYIRLSPEGVTAGELTLGGTGIPIPAGTVLTSKDRSYQVQILDTVYIRSNRDKAYVRVVSSAPRVISIPAGVLSLVEYELGDVENILPSALGTYTLTAGNTRSIDGGSDYADDTVYQYILKEKRSSLGLFNENTVNGLMDIAQVVNISLKEYYGGAMVYIETREPSVNEAVVETARVALRGRRSLGNSVNVYSPLFRKTVLSLSLELERDDLLNVTKSSVQNDLYQSIINTGMGSSIDLPSLVSDVCAKYPDIKGNRLLGATYNGRKLIGSSIKQAFNEKATITREDILIA